MEEEDMEPAGHSLIYACEPIKTEITPHVASVILKQGKNHHGTVKPLLPG